MSKGWWFLSYLLHRIIDVRDWIEMVFSCMSVDLIAS